MTEKPLSPSEIRELLKNPYVRSASTWIVTYTDGFREEFLRRHAQGMTYRAIFESLGFDVEILGKGRIAYFGRNLSRQMRAGRTPEDHRKYNRKNCKRESRDLKMDDRQVLEKRVRYLERVNVQLKKSFVMPAL